MQSCCSLSVILNWYDCPWGHLEKSKISLVATTVVVSASQGGFQTSNNEQDHLYNKEPPGPCVHRTGTWTRIVQGLQDRNCGAGSSELREGDRSKVTEDLKAWERCLPGSLPQSCSQRLKGPNIMYSPSPVSMG